MSDEESTVKNIVAVGDGTVGKTCLLYAFNNETFREDYVPTIYEKSAFPLILDGVERTIKLHDTAGQEDFDRLRKVIYKHADCFLLCYSVENRTSFINIPDKWIPELKSINRPVPIVLVATKIDLRKSLPNCITTEEGQELSEKINANIFIECSAKENQMIKEVIYEAVRAAVVGVQPPKEDDSYNDCIFPCCTCCHVQ